MTEGFGMPNIFFTSDTHFYHKNIIKYCDRPFKDVDEMNFEMIKRWNAKVQPHDTVYHLGDVTFAGSDKNLILHELNGFKKLIPGNHDNVREMAKYFDIEDRLFNLSLGPHKIVLCHYPIESWENAFHGWYHFHGHTHGHTKEFNSKKDHRVDVGVDVHNFEPVSYDEILDYITMELMHQK